jgi:hypothetical protein
MSFCERLFRTYGTLMLEVCEAMFGDSNCATESRIAILAFMYDEIYLLKETSQGLDTQLVNHLKLAIDTRLQYLCTMFSDSNWNENFALTYFGNMDSLPPWVPNQEYPYRSMFEVITRPNMFYERIRQSVPYNVDFFDLLNKTVDGLSGISATIRDCKCCWIISCIPDAVLKLCRLPSPVMTDYSQLHISSVHQYIEYTLSSEEPVFQVKDLATENDGLENWLDFRGVILAVFHWFFSHIQDLDISRRVCLKEKISATSATYAYVAMTLVVIGVASNDASYIGTVIRKEAWTSRFGMEHIAQFCWETLDKPPFEGYYAAWLDITQQIFDQENGRPTES